MKSVKTLRQKSVSTENLLQNGLKILKKAKIANPAMETEIIFAAVLGKTREYLYTHPDNTISPSQKRQFQRAIIRRSRREPLAYITGQKEFYGHPFIVNRRTLIPRPETEQLVDLALNELQTCNTSNIQYIDVIDVGTGSGAIIVSLVKTLLRTLYSEPLTRFYAIDSSKRALVVTHENAKRLGVEQHIQFLHGDLLLPYIRQVRFNQHRNIDTSTYRVILANLPYLTNAEMKHLQPEVRFEPTSALLGGKDGLDIYRIFFEQLARPEVPFTAICEIAPQQKKTLSSILKTSFPSATVEFFKDFSKRIRFVRIQNAP
ncbi:MAG TPA: peptide chain release factor N(5)-glutamine methyltransferase [Patescibacteria group bacterium]|nr:peptide chain release factor N(5)-glutamine methyltransferase [Patescibacteria group bacterium]